MQTFKISPVICSIVASFSPLERPVSIDLKRYSGKWFVIACIPTRFDDDWNYITETYTLLKDGNVDIRTRYRKKGKPEEQEVRSKGFPVEEEKGVWWKVQFIWPFKVNYVVEEIADDYSWVVIGHPKKKFLYIMSRNKTMNEELLARVKAQCRVSGYDISKLRTVSQ
ncbi:MAG: lipocalin family protein [Bacteroidia bacterium]